MNAPGTDQGDPAASDDDGAFLTRLREDGAEYTRREEAIDASRATLSRMVREDMERVMVDVLSSWATGRVR